MAGLEPALDFYHLNGSGLLYFSCEDSVYQFRHIRSLQIISVLQIYEKI